MLFRLWILFLYVTLAWSQDLPKKELPKTLEGFNRLFLTMKIEDSPEEIEKKKMKLIQDRLDAAFGKPVSKEKKETSQMSFTSQTKLKEFLDCLHQAVSGNIMSTLECRDDWKAISMGDLEALKRRGIELPDDFAKKLANEMKAINSERENYTQKDELVVMEDILVFEEDQPEILHEIDPKVTSFAGDVTQVLLTLSKSAEVKDIEALEMQQEVMVLGEVISRIQSLCPDGEAFKNSAPMFLKDLNVTTETGKENAAQYLLGVELTEATEKLESYTFVENGITYYLYKGKRKNNEDHWVMAKLNPEGKMSFEYFRIGVHQPVKANLKDDHDISLLKAFEQKDRGVFKDDKRFYFQAQEGVMLKAEMVNAPVIGKAIIPEARLVLGKLNMAYITKNTISQSNLLVQHDRVSLGLESKPSSGKWSLGGQVKYSPFKNDVFANANVRVYNVLVGYGANSKGESMGNVSYVLSRNFISYQTGNKTGQLLAIGRQFKNGKGYVSATTDFEKIHEVKLILLLK